MKRFPNLPKEEHLEINFYKFTPQSDITAYELALITDALLLTKVVPNGLLQGIIKKWPLPTICRHIEQRKDKKDRWNFETELKKSIQQLFKESMPSMMESWWKDSVNKDIINKWLRED